MSQPRGRRVLLVALAGLACCLAGAAAAGTAKPIVVPVDGAVIELSLEGEPMEAGLPAVLTWVRRSASIVRDYYGQFPVRRLTLRLRTEPGDGVHGGRTFGAPSPLTEVRVGHAATGAQLADDWVLVHELTHLALPDTGERHAWLSEGVATYVEGIARVHAGNRSERDVWAEELRSMPRGLPQPGDAGLDHTHTWGRTYWGGAMFCLLADVGIRERTHLRYGLEDALRTVLRASGGLAADWPIERVLATGDAAVGTTTLEDLYAQMKDTATRPDLADLWRRLGVSADGESVTLSDAAPLAAVRHAIMTPTATAHR